ncbi:hypothetical protein OsI_35850 [Oryza sativa Indica Group]|uniref:Protein kinase domain-containing protein n=1 Tax=Oryza sativa subsp. indica TaxID=39946 RepID=A2ZDI7_ORYSI|nr:hypothetical protein OsI_35850 [Oryza sativa Indica Group]
MAHEKPIRFTPRQLAGFTRGYSARLGAGGFGTVYGGALPNGLGVAVKVLRGGMGRRLFSFCFDAAVRALVYEFMGDGALDAYLFDWTRAVGDSDGLRSPPSSSLWAEAAQRVGEELVVAVAEDGEAGGDVRLVAAERAGEDCGGVVMEGAAERRAKTHRGSGGEAMEGGEVGGGGGELMEGA